MHGDDVMVFSRNENWSSWGLCWGKHEDICTELFLYARSIVKLASYVEHFHLDFL